MFHLNFHWSLFGVPLTAAEGHTPDLKEERESETKL